MIRRPCAAFMCVLCVYCVCMAGWLISICLYAACMYILLCASILKLKQCKHIWDVYAHSKLWFSSLFMHDYIVFVSFLHAFLTFAIDRTFTIIHLISFRMYHTHSLSLSPSQVFFLLFSFSKLLSASLHWFIGCIDVIVERKENRNECLNFGFKNKNRLKMRLKIWNNQWTVYIIVSLFTLTRTNIK